MKFKESKQKFYMRNVYINQIMKPQIQNNLNYAYFENPRGMAEYCNNQAVNLNNKNIFFNNKPVKTFYQNYIPTPNQNKLKKGTFTHRKSINEKDGNFFVKNLHQFNQTNTLGKNKKNEDNHINERSFSENKTKNFIQTCTVLKKNAKKNENVSYLRVNQSNRNSKMIKQENKENENNDIIMYDIQNKNKNIKSSNNENTSSRNTNSNSSLKSIVNSKKCFINERNKKQNIQDGKNTYNSEFGKNSINEVNKVINFNKECTTSPNSCNNSYNCKINNQNYKNPNHNYSGKTNIKSYKYYSQNKNFCCKSVEKKVSRNTMNYKNNMNINNSPNMQQDEFKNIDNISTLNSPSVPSYSSIIDDNLNNSKNYVWIKKNIKNNKFNNNLDNNYLYNYYKKPNINKDNIINQNLLNFANDITNINSSLYNTEIYYPDCLSNDMKIYEEKNLFDHSATLIQSVFRGYLVKRKFDILYYNYKYYYNKGIEILELILDYFFKKSINLIEEKQRLFIYLKSLRKVRAVTTKNKNKNKINKKPKSYKNFKIFETRFSPSNINNRIKTHKHYHEILLHKEIGERFNIVNQNNNEKDIEKRYKDKLDGINIKLNKLMKENNILKDINQKNIIKESKYREMSQDNKKKDDIINIITNDNKTLAKKLKIIQDKFNELQIQNQDYINYNSDSEQLLKEQNIDLFEEYRNIFLELIIHKNNEKYYLSVLRKYFNKFRLNALEFKSMDKTNEILKKQKLKNIFYNSQNKKNLYFHKKFVQFNYNSILNKKELENRNNKLKYILINIIKNKEKAIKSYLRENFYKFYYKGIIYDIKKEKHKRIIVVKKENYKKIKDFLIALQKRRDRNIKNIKREYFIKWHLYTKILALKTIINDKRRKKRQKKKMKKRNDNEATNKYLTNNKILHFGKSNIYILNKDKEKELLISLDKSNQNYLLMDENNNINNKYNNVIQATEKLGEIFYKAAQKHELLDKNNSVKEKAKHYNNDKDNIFENNVEEEEDSGDSFGL